MTRDDSYTPFGGRRSGPPSPVLVQRLWRVPEAQSGKVLSCGLYALSQERTGMRELVSKWWTR